jgi:uncharacterized damage-inducible protein DinB
MKYYGSEELARSFRTVRGNTLEAAREIPEEKYGFAPAPGCRTVEKLLTHIALAHRFQFRMHAEEKRTDLDGFDFPALMAELAAEEAQSRTKAEVIDFLEREGEQWAGFLDGLSEEFLAEHVHFPEGAEPPSKSRFEMILSVKEHEMHHRGQLMVVQRLLGLVPHLTRQRDERMAQARARSASAS